MRAKTQLQTHGQETLAATFPKPPSAMPDSGDPLLPDDQPQDPSAAATEPLIDKLRAAAEQRLAHLCAHLRLHQLELDLGNADVDAGSKSLVELDLGNTYANAGSKSLVELDLGNADAHACSRSLEESKSECVNLMSNVEEELGSGDVGVRSKSMEELELGDANADSDMRDKKQEEFVVVDGDVHCTLLDKSEVIDEDVKGKNLDPCGLTFLAAEGVADVQEVMLSNNGGVAEVAPEGNEAMVAAAEKDTGPLSETIVVAQEEFLAVPVEEEEETDGEEEDEDEEEKDATGFSLGVHSANDYDSMDVEDGIFVENLDEDDSGNAEAVESEDDAFDECRDEEEVNWRIGQWCNSNAFASMEFENLNKGDVEMRNEMSFDDGFSGKMGSLHGMPSTNLLQAMNSIPVTYNVTDNTHDLPLGDLLATGTHAHKNGVDLAMGSSFFFGNNGKSHIGDIDRYNDHMQVQEQFPQGNGQKRMRNSNSNSSILPVSAVFDANFPEPSSLFFGNNGKRHIGDIDGYNDHMQVQEQFPQGNGQKRMRNSNNSSSILPVSAVFDAKFSDPIQNLMLNASMFYQQKEKELQDALVDKQNLVNSLQEKEAIIQSLNSARFEQQNKWQVEVERFKHDLNVMAQLVTGYKKALKQSRASFDKYRRKFPCDKPLYGDVPGGGGLVLSVKELKRKRFEEEQQKLAAANEMIKKFQDEWFSKLDGWVQAIHFLWSKTEELAMETKLLIEKRKTKKAAPATEE